MKLKRNEIEALKTVAWGADVTCPHLAKTLRELAKQGLCEITKPAPGFTDPAGHRRQRPHFGCMTTEAGNAAIRGTAVML